MFSPNHRVPHFGKRTVIYIYLSFFFLNHCKLASKYRYGFHPWCTNSLGWSIGSFTISQGKRIKLDLQCMNFEHATNATHLFAHSAVKISYDQLIHPVHRIHHVWFRATWNLSNGKTTDVVAQHNIPDTTSEEWRQKNEKLSNLAGNHARLRLTYAVCRMHVKSLSLYILCY